MSNKNEYFNAKFAGDRLGDQWVVRGSDFDDLERKQARLVEVLRMVLPDVLDSEMDGHLFRYDEARAILQELEGEL